MGGMDAVMGQMWGVLKAYCHVSDLLIMCEISSTQQGCKVCSWLFIVAVHTLSLSFLSWQLGILIIVVSTGFLLSAPISLSGVEYVTVLLLTEKDGDCILRIYGENLLSLLLCF